MLTHRIRVAAPPRRLSKTSLSDKEHILSANINKCWFKVGDRVKFKKPKRNPIYGTIVAIQDKVDEVVWSETDIPYNIVLEVEKFNAGTKQISTDRVRTNVKKLTYVGKL